MAKAGKLSQSERNRRLRSFKIFLILLPFFVLLIFITFYFFPASSESDEPPHMQGDSFEMQGSGVIATEEKSDEVLSEGLHETLPEELPEELPDDLPNGSPEESSEESPEESPPEEQYLIESGEPEIEITGVAYLTFDDGPSRAVTPGILDLLLEENIKATFFVLPRVEVEDIYVRIIDEGHEIGNHSYSHNFNRLYKSGIDAFKEDILRAHNYLIDNFGYSTSLFRFPGGSMTWDRDVKKVRVEVLDELGFKYFDWHIDSGDARSGNADTSAGRLVRNVLDYTDEREHVIILMHDYKWRASTLEALPAIIDGLREQGYVFDIMSNYPG